MLFESFENRRSQHLHKRLQLNFAEDYSLVAGIRTGPNFYVWTPCVYVLRPVYMYRQPVFNHRHPVFIFMYKQPVFMYRHPVFDIPV